MKSRIILNENSFNLTINRLCYQLIENYNDFSDTVIIGLQPRGIFLSERVVLQLNKILGQNKIEHGNLDITFFRDDFRKQDNPIIPKPTKIDFIIEDKKVILIDDVLFTGRTIRSGLDALMAFGRPLSVELLVLVDRRFSRHLPIQPNYVGITVDTMEKQKVVVEWKQTDGKDTVKLIS